ncbi:MAG: enolase [Rhodospirillaceae bacterium]|jgi:L-alanine-DL-glutamate epimerase-like enolase superfamily enzyme|nr:enolase [Rhodospirillaceae bacterium]
MKITGIEDLHCDAGWRNFSFLKIMTDEGIVGYSEYNEGYGSKGLTGVIRPLAESLIGTDPRAVGRISAGLYGQTRQAPGGLISQAIAAIENALVDIKAKGLGIPVYEMLGGAVRDEIELYWSHCGTYRLHHHEILGVKQLNSLEGCREMGREVADAGFRALKTNMFLFEEEGPQRVRGPEVYMPGFSAGGPSDTLRHTGLWDLALNPDDRVKKAVRNQILALQEGAGPGVKVHLDINFNFKTEGFLGMVHELDDLGLQWFEIDTYNPTALRDIRRSCKTPIASCESLYGRRQYRPFFEQHSVDVAIIDVPWNGILESVKIAAMAEPYEINVAPHNFYGHLSTLMSAHFCAVVPHLRIMEIDPDDVPWKDDLVTVPPVIENGVLKLPTGPGWGADPDEDAIRAHPPKGGWRG